MKNFLTKVGYDSKKLRFGFFIILKLEESCKNAFYSFVAKDLLERYMKKFPSVSCDYKKMNQSLKAVLEKKQAQK